MRKKGTGSITSKGYLRVFVWDPKKQRKRLRMEHQVVWERAHGEIPEGFEIHHKDHCGLNNWLDNLELVQSKIHTLQHHTDYYQVDGVWMRKCQDCGAEVLRSYARSRHGRCRNCYNRNHKEYMTRTGRTNQFEYIAIRDERGRILTRVRAA